VLKSAIIERYLEVSFYFILICPLQFRDRDLVKAYIHCGFLIFLISLPHFGVEPGPQRWKSAKLP